jgi:hypothetical protein
MRRWSLLPVLGTILAFAWAAPVTSSAQSAGEDFVAGTFTVGDAPPSGSIAFEATVDARSGPSGENPVGTFVHSPNGFPSLYSVACLHVTGNTAIVGINYSGAPDAGLLFRVVDASVDTFSPPPTIGTQVGPHDCTGPVSFLSPLPVIAGDIVIHDARPLPATKDQCKNGGWKTFGVFKNQGDCVSFVATKGKNPPANSP